MSDESKQAEDLDNFVKNNRDVLDLLERVFNSDPQLSQGLGASETDTPIAKLDAARQDTVIDVTTDRGEADQTTEPRPEDLPKKIGRFEIKRMLGQGGFGMVFLARDPRLKRDVALKIPRPEAVMTEELRTRFVREAETAAALNHANIVPVYEAGNFGPICYIASAYCDGSNLKTWQDEKNELPPIGDVAAMVISLADAVQHAHSRGVIHRDLKPDNILVNAAEIPITPRITDFGLAKSMDETVEVTRTGSLVGTPSYMSPEQVNAKLGQAGPASDVYSLGAIMYFLLCGCPPLAGDSLLETIKLVQDASPKLPSKIRYDVPADLEAICLHCLAKEPSRRYQTASELQADLVRFVKGMPVLARKPSALDRVLLWCRRRPAVAGLAVSLLLVLAVSSVALSVLLVRSNDLKVLSDTNAANALEQRNRMRESLLAMTSEYATSHSAGQRQLSNEQKEFLAQTVAFYGELVKERADSPEDQFWIAQAEHRLANMQRLLGMHNEALAATERAWDTLEQIPSDWEPDQVRLELGSVLHDRGTLVSETRDIPEAIAMCEHAVRIARGLIDADPENHSPKMLLSQSLSDLGAHFRRVGRIDESLAAQTECIVLDEQLSIERPQDLDVKRRLGISCLNLGNLLTQLRRMDEAQQRLEQSLVIREELLELQPDQAKYRNDLAYTLDSLGGVAIRNGNVDESEAKINQAVEIRRRLVEQFPLSQRYRNEFVKSLFNLAIVFKQQEKLEQSEDVLRESIGIAKRSRLDFPQASIYRLLLAMCHSELGTVLVEKNQFELAVASHNEAVTELHKMMDDSVDVARATRQLEAALANRASALGYVDRHEDAIADWQAVIEMTRPEEVDTFRLCKATSLVKHGETAQALQDAEQILSETLELPPEQRNFNVLYNAACVYSLVSARTNDESESRGFALKAIELVQQAIDAGLPSRDQIRSEPEFEPIREYPEFQAIIDL